MLIGDAGSYKDNSVGIPISILYFAESYISTSLSAVTAA